ncbi:MAG TPA: hypothetical protein GX714_11370 [Chloroflexi bacterium]|nr:hypothetical protein [Chloroflexota bacterium]
MRRTTLLDIAFVLLLAALPFISIGTMNEQPLVWQLGFLLLVVGLLMPPALRLRRAVIDARDLPDVEEEPS